MSTDALSQIKELEAQIEQLRSSQVVELKEKLHQAKLAVAALESELAKLTGKAPEPGIVIRRPRTSAEEIRGQILKALAATPTGMSQKEIADATGLSYATVTVFLKKNAKDFRTTGTLKSKRFFLK